MGIFGNSLKDIGDRKKRQAICASALQVLKTSRSRSVKDALRQGLKGNKFKGTDEEVDAMMKEVIGNVRIAADEESLETWAKTADTKTIESIFAELHTCFN